MYTVYAWHQILLQIPTFWHLGGLNKTFKMEVFEASKNFPKFKQPKKVKRLHLFQLIEKYLYKNNKNQIKSFQNKSFDQKF